MVLSPGPTNSDLLGLTSTQNKIVILSPDDVGHPVCCLSHHCPSSPNSSRVRGVEHRAFRGGESKQGWAEHTALWCTCGVVGHAVSPILHTRIHV